MSGDGGNEGLAVDASGNVGIGTANPATPLDVDGNVSMRGGVFNSYDPSINPSNYLHRLTHGGDGKGSFQLYDNGTLDINLTTGGNSYINTGSNVGIGTTSPAYKLDVNGAVNATSVLVNGVAVGAGGTQWASGGGGVISYTGGNVGIGTTAPARPLHLEVPNAYNSAHLRLTRVGAETLDIGSRTGMMMTGNGFDIGTTDGTQLRFHTNGAQRMTIMDTTGNVGVGTTSPGYKLDVAESSTGDAAARLYGSNAGTQNVRLYFQNAGSTWHTGLSTTNKYVVYDATNSHYAFVADAAGNVGIGTASPAASLHLKPNADTGFIIEDDNSTQQWAIFLDNAEYTIRNVTGAKNIATFLRTGNVGIGTTSLGATQPRLAVVGDTSHILDVYRSGLAANTGRWGVQVGANGRLHFLTQNDDGTEISGGEKVTVLRDGNVGIGTASPAEKLEVSGNIKLSGGSPTYKITNVASPTASSDVATKAYVDAASGSPIKSIQRVQCTIPDSQSTCTVTISAVTTSKAYINLESWANSAGGCMRSSFNSTTQVLLIGSQNTTCSAWVIEYN